MNFENPLPLTRVNRENGVLRLENTYFWNDRP